MYRLAENLIVLDGEHGDVLAGNGRAFLPLHVENGKAFHDLIRRVQEGGAESLAQTDRGILELLRSQRILVEEEDVPAMPPGTATCRGVKGELTAYLPSGAGGDEQVWRQGLAGQMQMCRANQVLNLKFAGVDPADSWPHMEHLLGLVEAECQQARRSIQVRYHFASSLRNFPPVLQQWLEQHDCTMTVRLPLDNGLQGPAEHYEPVLENAKRVSDLGTPLWFVTPCVRGNVGELVDIAEAFSRTGNVVGCEFPVCLSRMGWDAPTDGDSLPDADDYTAALLDLYRSRVIRDDMLVPVNELRHRIVMGGYEPSCSCWHDDARYWSKDGAVYPCDWSQTSAQRRIDNVGSEPAPAVREAKTEWETLCQEALTPCLACQWRYLCGMACPVASGAHQASMGSSFVQKYYCQPRIALLEAMIWDIVGEVTSQKK